MMVSASVMDGGESGDGDGDEGEDKKGLLEHRYSFEGAGEFYFGLGFVGSQAAVLAMTSRTVPSILWR